MIDSNIVLYTIIFAFFAVLQRSSGFCFFIAGFASFASTGSYTMPDKGARTRAIYLLAIAIGFVAIGLILRKNQSK
jgi:hypothetical protein